MGKASAVVPMADDQTLFDAGEAAVTTPPSASLFDLDFFAPLPIHIEASDAPLTSDAGLLPLRQFDERIGLTRQLAAVLDDPRDPELTEHTFLEMVRSRVFGILAGYEDQNDHDALRTDPVFKLIADRSPEEDDLASQPTLSRFENQINIASPKRLRKVLVDQFIASFAQPPLSLTFDLDAVDDPTHGVAATHPVPRLLRAVPVPAAGRHLGGDGASGDGQFASRHGRGFVGSR